jgi:hypothetical protein
MSILSSSTSAKETQLALSRTKIPESITPHASEPPVWREQIRDTERLLYTSATNLML